LARDKIGIIGGSGFVGYSLAQFLCRNFDIRILDVRPPTRPDGNIDFVNCDVRVLQDVEECLKDLDFVLHTAIVQIPRITEQKRIGYEVNFTGTQNVCEAVDENLRIKGMILASSWHTIGERGVKGVIDEEFGFRPDKVEDRARLYALSKIAQECTVRFFDEMSDRVFGIIRMGTVLGADMPVGTAADVFIEKGLRGEAMTVFRHSMYRPMLYVDIDDVCRAFERFLLKILNKELDREDQSQVHIFNVCSPKPTTILDLAEIVRRIILELTRGEICPKITIVDKGQEVLFNKNDVNQIKVDIGRATKLLGLTRLRSPEQSIREIIKKKMGLHS